MTSSPPGATRRCGGGHEAGDIADMLDDLHGEDDLEAGAGLDQRLGGLLPVVDRELALLGVAARQRRCSSPPHRCRSRARPGAPEAPRAARRRSRYRPAESPASGRGVRASRPNAGGGAVADIGEADRI